MTLREMIRQANKYLVVKKWNDLVGYSVSHEEVCYLTEELLSFDEEETCHNDIVVKKLFSSTTLDVSYRENGIDYAMDLMDRREFIDCEVIVENILLSTEHTLAAIFDEITFYGLTNDQILEQREKLKSQIENMSLEDLEEIDLDTL